MRPLLAASLAPLLAAVVAAAGGTEAKPDPDGASRLLQVRVGIAQADARALKISREMVLVNEAAAKQAAGPDALQLAQTLHGAYLQLEYGLQKISEARQEAYADNDPVDSQRELARAQQALLNAQQGLDSAKETLGLSDLNVPIGAVDTNPDSYAGDRIPRGSTPRRAVQPPFSSEPKEDIVATDKPVPMLGNAAKTGAGPIPYSLAPGSLPEVAGPNGVLGRAARRPGGRIQPPPPPGDASREEGAQSHLERAWAVSRARDYKAAERAAMEALWRDPRNPRAYEALAWAQLRQGRPGEAMESASRAIELDGASAAAYAIRAYAKEVLGDRAGSLADIERAAALDKRFEAKLRIARSGGRIYDPEEDESTLLGEAAAARGGAGRGPWRLLLALAPMAAAAAAGLLLLRRRRRSVGAPPPAVEPAPAGRVGKYEIVRIIGRGGMGEVFEGVDKTLDRPVALKKLSERILKSDERARELFLKEARTVATLRHPAIVDVYEILEVGADVYLVFEFVPGKTVEQLLAESRRLSPLKALEILRPVCEALGFAHAREVVHRDLKPANIMVTGQGRVKLMDFGIARSLAEPSSMPEPRPLPPAGRPSRAPGVRCARTMSVVGTPTYMAPEIEEGLVCGQSDVYSLGVCLYEMLTGEAPFPPPSSLVQKLGMKFRKPSLLVPELPPGLDELATLALQPDPKRRIQTAAEFLERLEVALSAPARAFKA